MLERVHLPMNEFLNRLQLESTEGTRFCWLIGAGMSVTAGMPLAKDISRRIILLEHLAAMRLAGDIEIYPWSGDTSTEVYSKEKLDMYFNWYDALAEHDRDGYLESAMEWLSQTRREFDGITVDEPSCYSLIFETLLGNTNTHRSFLTTLSSRIAGINLAHLCLAALLKDYRHLGATVFTTNFDDLLQKAILSLNNTVRVFGELDSRDEPRPDEIYPQIVHLHGRHTGYRLLNTKEQIKKLGLNNPELKTVFRSFLRHSHLIVLGYSGWDDLITTTLAEWPSNPNLLGGTLYWIPFEGREEEIHPTTREFLAKAPPHRVKLIIDEQEPLSADSFMLRMLDTIARSAGGFRKYRKEFLDYAIAQHTTFLEHLRAHPRFDPESALKHATLAAKAFQAGDREVAAHLLKQAREFGTMEDVRDEVRAPIFYQIGFVSLAMGDEEAAEKHLRESNVIWDTLKGGEAELGKARASIALGTLFLRSGDLDEAEKRFKIARYYFHKNGDGLGSAFANKAMGDLNLARSKPPAATLNLKTALKYFEDFQHNFGVAICKRSLGEAALMDDRPHDAEKEFQEALSIFTEYGDELGQANCLKGIGVTRMNLSDYPGAERLLEEARTAYQKLEQPLGVGHVLQAFGDLKAQRGDDESALAFYKEALTLFESLRAGVPLANTLAELLSCHGRLKQADQSSAVLARISECRLKGRYPYLDQALKRPRSERLGMEQSNDA